jgi:Cu(I)/Ag(I) efflux system protein CusF
VEIEMMKFALVAALAGGTTVWAAAPDWTRAEVVKVEPERARVLLKHERIKSIGMEAMTMPFKADPKVDLKRFKAGDQVRFTVSNKDDHLVVEAMEKAR